MIANSEDPVHAVATSLRVQMCTDHVDLGNLVFLVSSILSGSDILSASLHHRVPYALRGRDLMEVLHLGLSVPRSPTLHIMSGWGSLYFSSCTAGEASLLMTEQDNDL